MMNEDGSIFRIFATHIIQDFLDMDLRSIEDQTKPTSLGRHMTQADKAKRKRKNKAQLRARKAART